jgi:hypothetical protein
VTLLPILRGEKVSGREIERERERDDLMSFPREASLEPIYIDRDHDDFPLCHLVSTAPRESSVPPQSLRDSGHHLRIALNSTRVLELDIRKHSFSS